MAARFAPGVSTTRLITLPMMVSMIRSGGVPAGNSPQSIAAWMMVRAPPKRARTMVCTFPSNCGGYCGASISTRGSTGAILLRTGSRRARQARPVSHRYARDQLVEDLDHLGPRLRVVGRFGDIQGGFIAGPHEHMR